ncbi:MAG TPA: DUF4097 family beta strand repeat-containing protein [Ktedonobacteraceae bacterium]|jgi:hypothetical protein
MFSPQENVPHEPEPRQVNIDLREQNSEYQSPPEPDSSAYSAYEQGYGGYASQMEGEKLRPSRPVKHKMWMIILIVALIVLGGSIINAILGLAFTLVGIAVVAYVIWRLVFNQSMQLPTQSFTVSGQPDLIVDNPFGAIRIHRGSVNTVEVRATRYYSSLLPSPSSYPLDATQQENQIKVQVWNPQARRTFSLGDIGRIDLDIVTPESSDLHIRSDASTISVDGIRGQAIIHTNAGTIEAKNASLSNQSSIHTNAGTINFQDVNLDGDARLETNAGTITFIGSIKPGGQYFLKTNAGTIDVALPADTAFTLDAKTDLGTVSNHFGDNSIGKRPFATLHLQTNLGTITIKPLPSDGPASDASYG